MSQPRSVSDYVDFDPSEIADAVFVKHSERIMYGSDFLNLPHPNEEREGLLARDFPALVYRDLFGRTADRFLGEV